MKTKVMVISAHADDLCLGMGATAAHYDDSGAKIINLILGKPIMSSRGSDVDLEDATYKANGVLGVETFIADLPDQRFDSRDILEINKIVFEEIEKFKPHLVFTHWYDDVNRDHKITYEATMVACRLKGNIRPKELLSFQTPGASEWAFKRPQMNVFVDVTKQMERKARALKFFEEELVGICSLDALEARARYYGSIVGVKYAEAFELIRRIK